MAKLIQPRVYVPGRTLRVVLVVALLLVWAGVRERRNRGQMVWTQTGEAFGSTYTVKVFPAPAPGVPVASLPEPNHALPILGRR